MCLQLDALSELKSSTDDERAELSNELLTSKQSLTERTKELQRLQENFDQVSSSVHSYELVSAAYVKNFMRFVSVVPHIVSKMGLANSTNP